jgi:hypothetical protein
MASSPLNLPDDLLIDAADELQGTPGVDAGSRQQDPFDRPVIKRP